MGCAKHPRTLFVGRTCDDATGQNSAGYGRIGSGRVSESLGPHPARFAQTRQSPTKEKYVFLAYGQATAGVQRLTDYVPSVHIVSTMATLRSRYLLPVIRTQSSSLSGSTGNSIAFVGPSSMLSSSTWIRISFSINTLYTRANSLLSNNSRIVPKAFIAKSGLVMRVRKYPLTRDIPESPEISTPLPVGVFRIVLQIQYSLSTTGCSFSCHKWEI